MGAAIAFDCACSVLQLVRLRRSSALCGCPSCLELDQVENNPRVTLLPLRVTDRDKWEKGDDIPRVQEKIMAKPQKILCFVQRQRKKRFLLPKDTRKLVVIDEEEPEAPAPSFFLLKRVRYLRQAVDLAKFLRYFFSMKLLLKLLKLIHQHDILCTMPWCGCPSCLELDQVENNPRVTLLPLRVTDRDKWEKGDDIPRVQEKIMAKPQKILCFVQRQRKKRFLLPKDTRKLVVIDEEEPEEPRLSSCSSVWGICGKLWTSRIFCGTFFQLKLLFHAFFWHFNGMRS